MAKNDKYIVPMVERAANIIEFIYQKGRPVGVVEISEELNIAKASVYRVLYTLKKYGFIEQDDSGNYSLGISFIKYGSYVKSEYDLVKIARPFMKKLAEKTGESINLGILYDDMVVTIENIKGEDFYLVSRLIPVSPLNCSSMGKIYLSEYDDEELKIYFESDKLENRTINSITDMEEFKENRKDILDKGIAYDCEEYEYGLTCMGKGIRDLEGNLLMTLSISGPSSRLKHKGMEELEKELVNTTKMIENKLNKL